MKNKYNQVGAWLDEIDPEKDKPNASDYSVGFYVGACECLRKMGFVLTTVKCSSGHIHIVTKEKVSSILPVVFNTDDLFDFAKEENNVKE